MKTAFVLLFCVSVLAAEPAPRQHAEDVTSARHEFVIHMGGTMDGENTRTPIGYSAWSRAFEPMREARMENVGDAPVVNPWVLVNGRRDWRTVERIIAGATCGCANDRERAIAIWRFVIGHRFHATPNDGDNVDPVKQFNVYGYSLCGDIAQTIRQLWKVAGFQTRRGRPHGHCLTEVWFDNAWRSLDGDEQIICLARDNETIVGEEDIVRDHDLMKRTHTYGILAGENPLTDQFSASLHVYEGKREGDYRDIFGHRMDLTLRPGESLAWRWDNIGRYHGTNLKTGWGPQASEPLANGRLVYAPRTPVEAGEKVGDALVVPMASPYVIVGGKLDARGEAKTFISFDQKKWEPVSGNDLDPLFPPEGRPRYRYWLKFEPADALQSLRVENTLQMAPLSLPALSIGENRIVYTDESGGARRVRVSFEWTERGDSQPPAAPEAEFPRDGGEVEGTQSVFKWSATGTDYHFQLGNRADMRWPLSPTFDWLISKTPQRGAANWAIPWRGLLNPGQRYYWRVRARNKDGLWGAWSRTFSFTPQGPGVPLDVRYDVAADAIRWQANPQGRPPVKWRVHASDEKGFTASDTPRRVLWESGYEGKRDVRELPPTVAGETDKPEWRALTNAFYRVVAVDAQGVASGPSDHAAVPRPKFISQPPMTAKVGETYTYQPRVIRSLGDLRCKNYTKDRIYWAGHWNVEKPAWSLAAGPAWLKLNAETGELTGAPPAEAAGQEAEVDLICEIAGVGKDTQKFAIRVDGTAASATAVRKPDVIYVPTPQSVVDKMLEMADIKPGDVVYDLGCGDGRIVVTAAKRYGVKAFGFDIDPTRVAEALANVRSNKVEHLVTIKQADVFTLDLREATVVTLYLLPALNVRLMPQLEKLKPGSRILSHDFDMRGAKPVAVHTMSVDDDGIDEADYYEMEHTIYKWVVPWEKEPVAPDPAKTESKP